MIRVIEGNCYIFGPGIDGLYSVEKVARILEDGVIISYFRGNAHQQRHVQEEVFAEVGCNCIGGKQGHDWFEPEEIGLTREIARVKGKKLWEEKYRKLGKYS